MTFLVTFDALLLCCDLVGCSHLAFLLDRLRSVFDIARGGELGRLGLPVDKFEKLINRWYVLLLVGVLLPRMIKGNMFEAYLSVSLEMKLDQESQLTSARDD